MGEGLFARGVVLAAPDGRPILRGVSLAVPAGGRAWIEGAPGSGKRALLKVLAGLLRPEEGEVRLGGVPLWPGEGVASLRGRARIGFAFVQGGLLSNQTLRENLALPLRFAGRDEREADAALDRFDLKAFADLRPHALSARARRLAQLARIESLQPDAIFLAEPFEDLEGPDLALARDAIRRWAEVSGRLILISVEHADAELLKGARRLSLEAGRIQGDIESQEGAP